MLLLLTAGHMLAAPLLRWARHLSLRTPNIFTLANHISAIKPRMPEGQTRKIWFFVDLEGVPTASRITIQDSAEIIDLKEAIREQEQLHHVAASSLMLRKVRTYEPALTLLMTPFWPLHPDSPQAYRAGTNETKSYSLAAHYVEKPCSGLHNRYRV
jgi:hypothetical protein